MTDKAVRDKYRQHMREMAARGGRAGTGEAKSHPKTSEAARAAALARWGKRKIRKPVPETEPVPKAIDEEFEESLRRMGL